jgi:hypothetical protein
MAISKAGAALALIYIAIAMWVVVSERTSTGGGGWISLNGMASFLITFPVSAPLEMMGARPDYQKTIDMGAAILACAVLVYFIGAGLGWLARQMFTAGPDS